MRYFLTAFTVELGRKLRNIKTWVPVILLPLLIWACIALLPQQERAAPVQVGVVCPKAGAEEFRELLEQRSGIIVTFMETDMDTACGKVATGQWDCALVPAEDFAARIESLDFDGLFTLYIGENSAVYPLVREAVSASVAELAAPEMARDYMEQAGLYTDESAALAEELLSRILTEEDRILIEMETASGAPLAQLSLAEQTWNGALRGILAIVLLIWMLFTAVDLGRWRDSPAGRRMRPQQSGTALLLPHAVAAAVPALLSGLTACVVLRESAVSVLALLCYLAALTALAVLAARVRSVWTALPILMPVVPVLCLLLSPVIADFSLFVPALAIPQACLPVTMFLRACTGATGQLAVMAALAAAAVLCSVLADSVRRKL